MSTTRLRPLSGADRRDLVDLLDRCSAESLYDRFLTHGRAAGQRHVETLFADPQAYTVVAERRQFGGVQAAGFGSLFRDGPDDAEIALLVADAHQGHGIGTALAEYLCRHATAHGIRRLHLTALARNHRIAVLFRRYAQSVRFDVPDAGTVTATVRLALPEQQLAAA